MANVTKSAVFFSLLRIAGMGHDLTPHELWIAGQSPHVDEAVQRIMAHRSRIASGEITTPNAGKMETYYSTANVRRFMLHRTRTRVAALRERVAGKFDVRLLNLQPAIPKRAQDVWNRYGRMRHDPKYANAADATLWRVAKKEEAAARNVDRLVPPPKSASLLRGGWEDSEIVAGPPYMRCSMKHVVALDTSSGPDQTAYTLRVRSWDEAMGDFPTFAQVAASYPVETLIRSTGCKHYVISRRDDRFVVGVPKEHFDAVSKILNDNRTIGVALDMVVIA